MTTDDMAHLIRPSERMQGLRQLLTAMIAGLLLVLAVPSGVLAEEKTEGQKECAARSADALVPCVTMSLEQVITSTRQAYQDAGRLLVFLSETEVSESRVRSDAVEAVRSIVESFREMTLRTGALEGALENVPFRQPSEAVSLDQQLTLYSQAAQQVRKAADTVRSRIGDIVGQDAGPDLDARLSRFIATARQYSTEQKAFATATAALKDTLFASYLTRGPGAQAIRLSLYEFLDERGRLDSQYGLYTYVLFRTPDVRSQKLLQALFGSTGWAEDATKAEPSAINVFVVPVQNRIRALVAARSSSNLAAEIQAPDFYDYNYAGSLLVNLCVGLSADPPELCAEGGGGPYLLSHPDRLKRDSTVPEPYLLVDLSHVDERAFGEFVRAVKNQVMLSEFTNREKIDTLRLQLLDVALKASDWLVPVKNAVADIVIRSDSAEGQ